MTPLRNTNRFLSDFLPAALVKDWRQCLRSRGYLAVFALLLLSGWVLLATGARGVEATTEVYQNGWKNLGSMLCFIFCVTLSLAIPFRAGLIVAADTRERGSNFLMLTPLSARRIVWGTWCSTALMVLLAALLLLPLCYVGEVLRAVSPLSASFNLAQLDWVAFAYDALTLGALVLGGWVMAAFFMFCAGLPLAARIILLVGMIAFCGGLVSECDFIFCAAEKRDLPGLAVLLPGVADALLLLVLFLELARRHYSAPAENCSRSVRLLAPLPLLAALVQVGVSCAYGALLGLPVAQGIFGIVFLYFATFADALLPSYSLPQMKHRFWPLLPHWFQRPGFVPSVLCCAGAVLLSLLPALLLWAEASQVLPCAFYAEMSQDKLQRAAFVLIENLNMGFSLMLWLLLTDCFCRRNSPGRPLVFGAVALASCCFFSMMCAVLSAPEVEACLPAMGNTAKPWQLRLLPMEELWRIGGYNAAALLAVLVLLLGWRGMVKK